MATKRELEEQLAALQAENDELKAKQKPVELQPEDIEIGKQYYTSWGICDVKNIYTEDGLEKVQGYWRGFNRDDFTTPEGEAYLRSMPVRKFMLGLYEYPKFKQQRIQELARGAK